MTEKRMNKTTVRNQLRGTALSVMGAVDAGMSDKESPMEKLRDAAEALKALSEVLGQMESAEKMAETCDALKRQTAALGKGAKKNVGEKQDELRPGVIEIARVLKEDVDDEQQ